MSSALESYVAAHTSPPHPAVLAAMERTRRHRGEDQEMMAGTAEAALLSGLVRLTGARDVLEVGTFTGVGTLSLAAGLAPGGQVTTLEIDPDTAELARAGFAASPWAEQINLRVGDALSTLETLPGPFDLIWLDSAKADYPALWRALRHKLAPRGVLVADNLLRGGRVLDPGARDAATEGLRTFAGLVQSDPEFDNVLLSVGDGLLLAWRRPAPDGGPAR